MEYLIYSLIALIILTIGLNSTFKKQAKLFYVLAILIALAVTIYEFVKISTGFKLDGAIYVLERSFKKGYISTALFILVMFAGVLDKKWEVTKKLFKVRSEMAIVASILILPHCIVYLYNFLMALIKGNHLSIAYVAFIILGLMAFIIMIPLFITSFKKVRVKMVPKKWKSVQRWAYIFYILVYGHIMIILIYNKKIYWDRIIWYTAIFGVYLILKIYKLLKGVK